MSNKYLASFLGDVKEFIEKLPEVEQGKINAIITAMEEGNFESIYTKTLRTPIKELIIKKYRLIFFIHHRIIYIIRVFIKKTAKTPKAEIENAEKFYKLVIANIK